MNNVKKFDIKNWFSKNYESIILFLFSCLFSFALTMTLLFYVPMQQTKNYTAGLNVNMISLQSIGAYFIFVFVGFAILKKCYVKIISCRLVSDSISKNKFFIYSVSLNLLCWGLWYLTYFPGAGMNDTIVLLMGEPYQSSIQPLVYQLFIWYFMKFSLLFFPNMTLAYGFMVLVQMLFNAAAIAHVIHWLAEKQVKRIILWSVLFYYAFLPVVADYSITLVKDTLFSIFVLLFITQLYDIVTQNGECLKNKKFLVIFIITAVGMCSVRNNGFFVAFLSILVIILFLKKLNKKKLLIIVLCVILSWNMCISLAEKQYFNSDTKFREMIGVPLAQIGAVLNDEDSQLDESELEIINQLLPAEIWKENYRPSFSDKMKFNSSFNNDWLNSHKLEFLNVWANILKDNFSTYVSAYLCHTYGYWSVIPYFSNIGYTQSFFTKINNNTKDDSRYGEFCSQNGLQNKKIFSQEVNHELQTFFESAFTINLVLCPGIMFWLIATLCALLIAKKKCRIFLAFFPIILVWLTYMISSPASFIYRYSFYLVLALPVVFVLALKELESQFSDKSKNKYRKNMKKTQ